MYIITIVYIIVYYNNIFHQLCLKLKGECFHVNGESFELLINQLALRFVKMEIEYGEYKTFAKSNEKFCGWWLLR